MALQIGDVAPDFEADTTEGQVKFHDWLGDSWGVLVSHPKDFTPVCTTELGLMAGIKNEFDKRNAKLIGISVDRVDDHQRWKQDIQETRACRPISDDRRPELTVAKLYGMIHPNAAATPTAHRRRQRDGAQRFHHRTRQEDQADHRLSDVDRAQFRGDPAGDRLAAAHRQAPVATPANWKQGEDVIIAGSVSATRMPRRNSRKAGSRQSPISASSRSPGSELRLAAGRHPARPPFRSPPIRAKALPFYSRPHFVGRRENG